MKWMWPEKPMLINGDLVRIPQGTIIMNMDYSSNQLKVWSGYILTLAKTWFINSNQDDAASFGVLNRNKIAGMHELFPKIKKLKDSQ